MNKQTIVELLKDSDPQQAEAFASYVLDLYEEKDKKTGKWKNFWIRSRKEQDMVDLFKRVEAEGLVLDGKHITLQSTGISYDYVAYKNKMYLVYPKSTIQVGLVYEGDDFSFSSVDGRVNYHHKYSDPFNQKDERIKGAYCVIKNKRGEYVTLLSKEEITKHRDAAKTDYVWKTWFKEMAMKTVIKKACKYHFDDLFTGITEMDNENSSLENPVTIEVDYKQQLDEIDNLADLKDFWEKNRGNGKEVDQYIVITKKRIIAEMEEKKKAEEQEKQPETPESTEKSQKEPSEVEKEAPKEPESPDYLEKIKAAKSLTVLKTIYDQAKNHYKPNFPKELDDAFRDKEIQLSEAAEQKAETLPLNEQK